MKEKPKKATKTNKSLSSKEKDNKSLSSKEKDSKSLSSKKKDNKSKDKIETSKDKIETTSNTNKTNKTKSVPKEKKTPKKANVEDERYSSKPTNTKKERIKSGISGLDEKMEGGLINKSINLVEGGSGSAKTVFAIQFLLESIKKNESAMYITFEEKKETFFENMKKLGWNLEELEKKEKFIFLEYSPEKIKMMIDEGGGSIESLVIRHKVKRIAIDSITSFSMLFDTDIEKRSATMGLFDLLRKWDATTLLTVQHDPADKDRSDLSSLEFEVDGVINLYFEKEGGERKRYIEIKKMRGTKHSTDSHIFIIDDGIEVKEKVKN